MLVIAMTYTMCSLVEGSIPIYPHPLPIHPPHIDVGDHWCTRLVIYWRHHQLPFVPIDIRWYGWRWYVNTNDEWTVTLMSRAAVLLDVHHIRCNIGAAYQNKAYIRTAVMATMVRMIKEEGGLSLSRYEQRRRRLYRYFHRCTSSKSCNVFVAATTMTKGGTGESDIDEYRSPRCRWIWGGLREPLAAIVAWWSTKDEHRW